MNKYVEIVRRWHLLADCKGKVAARLPVKNCIRNAEKCQKKDIVLVQKIVYH